MADPIYPDYSVPTPPESLHTLKDFLRWLTDKINQGPQPQSPQAPWGIRGALDIFINNANANETIDPATNTRWNDSQNWQPRRDPLTLDLDNDGLETTGIAAINPILFDHDGDGIKNGTGWVNADDGFLVRDVNGNGSIDSGRELFGDSTIKSNGQLATDGFDALADLDSIANGGNADGMISSADAQFANLRVWRDLNQDGISQTDELFTLSSQNIASINITKTANSQTLANGNQIADLGTFTKTDGSTGTAGAVTGNLADVNLAGDTFHRTFPDVLDMTSVATLPDMQACTGMLLSSGSGAVRDLREAATQSKLSRVQLLSQNLPQATHGYGCIAISQRIQQRLVNQGLIAFTSNFTALLKTINHRIIQINGNASFAAWRNHSTTFSIAHIVISFHKISSQMARQALPKLNEYSHRAASSIPQQRALKHQHPPLQNALHRLHLHLHGLVQNHHKTQAQPQQKQHHAFVDLKQLSLGQIQSSCNNNTYNICINQALINLIAANDEGWRVVA